MAGTFVPYEMKTTMLRICSYDQKNPVGILENPFWGKDGRRFQNLTQMLFLLDELMDALDYPQRATVPRSMGSTLSWHSMVPERCSKPEHSFLASFRISILFRQNASWQGSIQWLEQNSVSQFRSALELIQLLDSVLSPYDHIGGEGDT